jgi:hypothetical protein
VKRWRGSPRSVDDQVRRETSRPSPRVLEAHPGNRAVVERGGQFRYTRARPELDIGLAFDTATADHLQHGARQPELIETEVALRKRIETRNLDAHVAANAVTNGAGLDEVELDAGKQTFERAAAARKEPMRVPRLRRAGAWRGRVGQSVAVEHNDLFEMGRDGLRRGEASDPGANDGCLLQNWIGLALVSRGTRCRPGNPRRSNGQQGERAPLRENFRDWTLRYVCNAAADPTRSSASSFSRRETELMSFVHRAQRAITAGFRVARVDLLEIAQPPWRIGVSNFPAGQT